MIQHVRKQDAAKLLGRQIWAIKKDGTRVTGKLVKISGNKLYLSKGKNKAAVKALGPLLLFDLLAIGTGPFGYGYPYGGFGGFGSPYGGFGSPYGGFGSSYGGYPPWFY